MSGKPVSATVGFKSAHRRHASAKERVENRTRVWPGKKKKKNGE